MDMTNPVEVEMVLGNEIHSEAKIEGTVEEVWAVLSDFGAYGE
jgi:hypothetical protein